MSNQGPPLLPSLVAGQKVQSGPFLITVTPEMVAEREQQNRMIARRWEAQQRRAAGEDPDFFGDFKEFNIRRRFVRRVFSILAVQLIFTSLIVSCFLFIDEAKQFLIQNPGIILLALFLYLVTYMTISCSDCGRRSPCNVICLILLTISMAYLTAVSAVIYDVEAVVLAMITTTFIVLTIAAIATCTKFDLTQYTGLMVIISLVGLGAMIILAVCMYIFQIKILQAGYAILGTLIISLYLFFDLQTIMGGRSIEIEPNEVVYAVVQLYVDIILIFKYILILCSMRND